MMQNIRFMEKVDESKKKVICPNNNAGNFLIFLLKTSVVKAHVLTTPVIETSVVCSSLLSLIQELYQHLLDTNKVPRLNLRVN